MSDVTIGVIAALAVEGAAMRALMVRPQVVRFDDDPNTYRVGYLASLQPGRPHRVALVTLAEDNTRNAALTCTDLLRSFPRIRCVVMTGIAGGVPAPGRPQRHVRLGDVVVAVDGIVDYGHVRQEAGGPQPRRPISGISMELKRAAQQFQQDQYLGDTMAWQRLLTPAAEIPMAVFARPPDSADRLYRGRRAVPHPDRALSGHPDGYPKLHFGGIGCADVLLKDAMSRDALAARHGVLAFEMETAGVASSVADRGLNWFVVRGIVDYCDEHKNDIWHAYSSLAAAACVRGILAQCPPFPVWRLAPAGARTLLPEWEMDQLKDLLAQARDIDGRDVWQAAVGSLIPSPDGPATLADLARLLAEQNAGPDLIPPLVAFTEHVAARVPHRLADGLRGWIDRVAEHYLHLEEQVRRYRQHVERSPGGADRRPIRPCLLIQIERDGIDSERLEVRYWIQQHSRRWAPEPSDPKHTTFRQLEWVLQAAIRHAETVWRDVGDRKPPEIELLLPTDLLHTAVEWWHTELDTPAPTPLCLDYRVVVRPLDRMRQGHRLRIWNTRWRSLWQHPPRHRVYWGRPEPGAEGIDTWNARLHGDHGFTTVVLGNSPEHESGSEELQSALNTGIPVILWDHRPGPLTPEMAGLLNRLTDSPPGELVDRVGDLRREVALAPQDERGDHRGRRVTLLWDDPDRNVYDAGAHL